MSAPVLKDRLIIDHKPQQRRAWRKFVAKILFNVEVLVTAAGFVLGALYNIHWPLAVILADFALMIFTLLAAFDWEGWVGISGSITPYFPGTPRPLIIWICPRSSSSRAVAKSEISSVASKVRLEMRSASGAALSISLASDTP
jgi:hypothetical protein